MTERRYFWLTLLLGFGASHLFGCIANVGGKRVNLLEEAIKAASPRTPAKPEEGPAAATEGPGATPPSAHRETETRQLDPAVCEGLPLVKEVCLPLAGAREGYYDLTLALAKYGYEPRRIAIKGKLRDDGGRSVYEARVLSGIAATAIVTTPDVYTSTGEAFVVAKTVGSRKVMMSNGFESDVLLLDVDDFAHALQSVLLFPSVNDSEMKARAQSFIDRLKSGSVIVPAELRPAGSAIAPPQAAPTEAKP